MRQRRRQEETGVSFEGSGLESVCALSAITVGLCTNGQLEAELREVKNRFQSRELSVKQNFMYFAPKESVSSRGLTYKSKEKRFVK
ncbi:hypothetical protein P4O66_001268 [Electrophorus voltai]|uniref:Uncharacterized protein n=1 Tax=Electrophorus voltai TaxID=2609070 RepID=A0AAD8ZAK3_9TELE|nr:hypothetical protein P4O66_001268 [Electrophorus voltai]